MMRVLLVSKDRMLGQKIRLMLRNVAQVEVAEELNEGDFDRILIDKDTANTDVGGALTISRYEGADILRPFDRGGFIDLFKNESPTKKLRVAADERCAYLAQKQIKLTEVEYRLLKLIYDAEDYVSRERILDEVWGVGTDGGVINVYVHYLREKLEKDGEKVIISSRKSGYKINEKYR